MSSLRRASRGERKMNPWPAEAEAARRAYQHRLDELVGGRMKWAPPVALRLLSFSSEHDVPEQVASIRTFLAHVGTPLSFTIASDGSHSARSRELLQAVHPCITVVDWHELSRPGLPKVLWDYARIEWRGKKLAVLVSLPGDRPVLYTDADILFFEPASELRELGGETRVGLRYLRDCGGDRRFLDRAMLVEDREGDDGVNSGFMFLGHPLDWTPALDRLQRQRWKPSTFTGQTVVHLTLRQAEARMFDPSRYVVAVDDRWLVEDRYARPETVLRHYVTPVRHKFWTTVSGLPAFTA
jgi:hypothetical protein